MLLACSDAPNAYDRLLRRRFPIVFFDRVPEGLKGSAVATDNIHAAYIATRHLLELGHKKIALLLGSRFLPTHSARREGFLRAMQEAKMPIRPGYIQHGGLETAKGYAAASELLRLPDPPTAIFSTNNRSLLGLVRAIAEFNIRCPEDISIVGFDDFVWTEYFSPKLTTVVQPTFQIGYRAMEALLTQITSKGPPASENTKELILLPAKLQIRQSTTVPPRKALVARARSSRSLLMDIK